MYIMYIMHNSICINIVFCSKPIYPTSFTGSCIFKCITNVYQTTPNSIIIKNGMKFALNKLLTSFYIIKSNRRRLYRNIKEVHDTEFYLRQQYNCRASV